MRRHDRTPTPDPRLAAFAADVAELFAAIVRGRRPADFEMAAFFRRRRLRDHALRGRIAEFVYAALRRAPYYEVLLDAAVAARALASDRRDAAMPFLAALEAGDVPRGALVAAFAGAAGMSGRALDALARWFDEHRDLEFLAEAGLERFAARHAFPLWVVAELAPTAPRDQLAALLEGLNAAPPLALRVNTVKTSVDEAERALRDEGIATRRGALSPVALIADRNRDPFGSRAFRAGVFELQDEGSQVVSLLVGARPGDRVLDLCAGSGGKTLHLGAIMRGRGEVFAYDTDARRLANITRRLRRSGLQNVRVVRTADEFAALEARGGTFDRVLVDAPCSGLGAVRRAPDIKLRATPALVALMVEKQRDVLDTAARCVRRGGRVVYATCSILPRENSGVVRAFLADRTDFRLVPPADAVAQAAGGADLGALRRAAHGADALTLAPHSHGTDGFFVAVLERLE